jgi:FdhD protein
MKNVSIRRLTPVSSVLRDDTLVVEEPLEIRVEGKPVAVTMRTPGHDRELAAGFLLSEGVITSASGLFDIVQCPGDSSGNVLDVLLKDPAAADLERLTRHVFTSSSCGVCGTASLEKMARQFSPISCSLQISREVLFRLPAALGEAQPVFQETGGLHAAALFDEHGTLLRLREDVGRHNALDKILGASVLEGRLPLAECVLLVSGRASFEILQKALAGGVGFVAAIGAPSSLAVETAAANKQTLAGFLRPDRVNIYSGFERVG